MLSNFSSQIQQEVEFIGPIVEERFAKMDGYGEDWNDRPVCQTIVTSSDISMADSQDDMLMWLVSEAKGVEGASKAWHCGCTQSMLQALALVR